MKNPLPVAHWLLLEDSCSGLLEESGFVRHSLPQCEGNTFARDHFFVHSAGFWLDLDDHRLLYSRSGKRFYKVAPSVYPNAVPLDAERVSLANGFEQVAGQLRTHEAWVNQNRGRSYRAEQFKKLKGSEKALPKELESAFHGQ